MTKKALAAAAVLLVGGAYLFGLVPQRQRRLALEVEVSSLGHRLEIAEDRARLGTIFARAHGPVELVAQRNYGQAQQLSSVFFDDVRAEAGRTHEPAFRDPLLGVLALRDAVTAALSKGDPAALEELRRAAALLQPVLEKPAAAAGPAKAPPP